MWMTDVQALSLQTHLAILVLDHVLRVASSCVRCALQMTGPGTPRELGATLVDADAMERLPNGRLPWKSSGTILAWQRSACLLLQTTAHAQSEAEGC